MYDQRMNIFHRSNSGLESILVILAALSLLIGSMSRIDLRSTQAENPITYQFEGKNIHLPLTFVPIQRQEPGEFIYHAQVNSGALFFGHEEIVLSIPLSKSEAAEIQLSFVNASAGLNLEAQELLPGVMNYLLGNEPDEWRTNLPTYGSLVYRQIYPGIDLTYNGETTTLKGTYQVAPGADPGQIRWRYSGAKSVDIDEGGNLVLTVGGENETSLTETTPVAWQVLNGERVPVAAHYAIHADGSVGFKMGDYDPGQALTIDPYLVFSTYFGHAFNDKGVALALGPDGSIYLAGETYSSAFPQTNSVIGNASNASVYVTKFSPNGDTIVYSTLIGGSGNDYLRLADITGGIAVDLAGHAFVTGYTSSTNFPLVNAFQATFGGSSSAPYYGDDSFILKLAPDGASLVYSSYIGGSGFDNAAGIGIDSAGNAYLAGQTNSSNFPLLNPIQSSFAGGFNDGFIAKVSPTGSLLFSTYFGGGASEFVNSATADGNGRVYFTGRVSSGGLATAGAFQTSIAGNYDAFVARINANTRQLEYFTYLGGYAGDAGAGIAVDQDGRMYVTGLTFSSDFPIHNALQSTLSPCDSSSPCSDAFITKLASDGSLLVYSTFLGGSDYENHYPNGGLGAIAVDDQSFAYVTGNTRSDDFPVYNAIQPTMDSIDFQSAFVAKIEPDGSGFVYSTYLGGSETDLGWGITADPLGNTYITGETHSTDFPTHNALQGSIYSEDFPDGFLVRISDAVIVEGVDLFVEAPSKLGITPGSTAGLSIRVGNQGLSTAGEVVLAATLPVDVSYLGDSSGVTPTINGNEVTWELGSFSFGQGTSFTLQLDFPSLPLGQSRVVKFDIHSNESDEVPGNNSTATTLIASRNVFLPLAIR